MIAIYNMAVVRFHNYARWNPKLSIMILQSFSAIDFSSNIIGNKCY